MKEVIFVILEGFADWEGAYIATCLNQGVKPGNPISYKVKTLSITQEPVSSIGGFRVLPDYGLKDMAEDYAGLVLIGGMNWFSPEAELIVPLVEKAIKEKECLSLRLMHYKLQLDGKENAAIEARIEFLQEEVDDLTRKIYELEGND